MTESTVERRRGRATLFGAGLVALLVVVALVVGSPASDGVPLDPRSTGPLGTRGLVLLLERLGADVVVIDDVPNSGAEVALVLDDRLKAEAAGRLQEWVSDGGILVVADPLSPLAAELGDSISGLGGLLEPAIARGECTIDALAGAERIEPAEGFALRLPDRGAICFGDDAQGYVVTEPRGGGVVVSVGGAGLFVNDRLGDADNAVVAGALLAPRTGTRVAFVEPPAPGSGEDSLLDLVSPQVKAALAQLGVAFVIYALWRARRLGRPVAEPQPTQIAGSELVVALGELNQQARNVEPAAALLRDDLRADLASRLGLPPSADPAVLADSAVARTGADHDRVLAAVAGAPVSSKAELLALAQLTENVRREVLHGPHPEPR